MARQRLTYTLLILFLTPFIVLCGTQVQAHADEAVKAQTIAVNYHNCVIQRAGNVKCWGANYSEQLNVPSNLGPVKYIDAGGDTTCAIRTDGLLRCWGRNDYGQANVPSGLRDVVQVSVGNLNTCAVTTEGRLYCWGNNEFGQNNLPDLGLVTKVAVGVQHTCAITTDKLLHCWGARYLNNFPQDLGEVKDVAAGVTGFTCVITIQDKVRCWGDNPYANLQPPSGLVEAKSINLSWSHVCAISKSGNLFCWGWNDNGQINVPSNLGQVKEVSTGDRITCAVSASDNLSCWGANWYGEGNPPGDLSFDSPTSFQNPQDQNPHYYVAVLGWSGSWSEAKEWAESSTYNNIPGHLVSISSKAENDFVSGLAKGQNIFTGGHGVRSQSAGNYIWTWSWMGSPEITKVFSTCIEWRAASCFGTYSNWDQTAPTKQPDLIGEDTVVMFNKFFGIGSWHDCPSYQNSCSASGFVIEYETPQLSQTPAPVIDGGSYVGSTLLANTSGWDDGVTFTYQWYRESEAISGANSQSYIPTVQELYFPVSVKVTGSKPYYQPATKTSSPTTILKLKDSMSGVKVWGLSEVGEKVFAKPNHTSSRFDYSYQWFRNGNLLDSETDRSYRLVSSDGNQLISVRVCQLLAGKSVQCTTQGLSTQVRPGTLKTVSAKFSGIGRVNRVLSAGKAYRTDDVSVTYQWLRNSQPIANATNRDYLVQVSDIGCNISLRVTVSKDGYISKTVDSTAKLIN